MIDAEMLNEIKFFEGLNTSELEQIAKLCLIVEFKKGNKIFSRGNKAENFYIIKEGKVKLCFQVNILLEEKEISADTKKVGDVFGWSALSEPYKLTLSANCDEDCKLIQMRGEEILSLCRKENHIGFVIMQNLAKVVSRRLAQMQFICEKEIEMNVPSFEGKH